MSCDCWQKRYDRLCKSEAEYLKSLEEDKWQGLTEKDWSDFMKSDWSKFKNGGHNNMRLVWEFAQARLKEKNNG
jgi:hypothetical protein